MAVSGPLRLLLCREIKKLNLLTLSFEGVARPYFGRNLGLTEAIDTETPTGRAMWQMVGVLAELERSLIQERTKAGREAAKRRGVKLGRKLKLSPQQVAHARKLIEHGESPAHVAQLLKVARSTLYVALGPAA
jgi:DNA invertase Pin-like site-specific DNA recombinase